MKDEKAVTEDNSKKKERKIAKGRDEVKKKKKAGRCNERTKEE